MLFKIRAVSAAARESGALKSIETDFTLVPFSPDTSSSSLAPSFLVRVLKNLRRKDEATSRDVTASVGNDSDIKPGNRFNPFLPYEEDMYVCHVPPAHVLLLNKFNVVSDHTLLVTSAYEEQNSLLTQSDFRALWNVLSDFDALAFYNGGRIAGASQHHKHLQLLPRTHAPFDDLIADASEDSNHFNVSNFPFMHAAADVADCISCDSEDAAKLSMGRYTQMLTDLARELDIDATGAEREGRQPFEYNMLATRRWMMVVPRREECFSGMSVNALGFVGCLLVRDNEQMQIIQREGPMNVLKHVTFAKGK